MSAGGGPGSDFGATVARGISAAVVSVTSRPSGPMAVDSGPTVSTDDVPAEPQPVMRDEVAVREIDLDTGAGAHEAPPACEAPVAAHARKDDVKDAGEVRDDLLDRTAEGDPSLRASVTEAVVGEGVPRADPDTPDPRRETGVDTNKPAR